jgi:hypothetical protein
MGAQGGEHRAVVRNLRRVGQRVQRLQIGEADGAAFI